MTEVNIEAIEKAVRANCNVALEESSPLIGDIHSKEIQTPRIIFVGLCNMYSIDEDEVMDHLWLKPDQYLAKRNKFSESLKNGQELETMKRNGESVPKYSRDHNLYVQVVMCTRHINSALNKSVTYQDIVSNG